MPPRAVTFPLLRAQQWSPGRPAAPRRRRNPITPPATSGTIDTQCYQPLFRPIRMGTVRATNRRRGLASLGQVTQLPPATGRCWAGLSDASESANFLRRLAPRARLRSGNNVGASAWPRAGLELASAKATAGLAEGRARPRGRSRVREGGPATLRLTVAARPSHLTSHHVVSTRICGAGASTSGATSPARCVRRASSASPGSSTGTSSRTLTSRRRG